MTLIGHGTEICTSTTRPSTAIEGMMIYETDTNKVLVNSSATSTPSWVEVTDLDNTYALRESTYNSIRRYGFQSRTSDFTVNSTTVAASGNVFSNFITWTADGTSTYKVEFWAYIRTDTGNASSVNVHLVDGSGNAITGSEWFQLGFVDNGQSMRAPCYAVHYITPSAGSYSVNVRATYTWWYGTIHGSASRPAYLTVTGPGII
jgi:hypothetical protein